MSDAAPLIKDATIQIDSAHILFSQGLADPGPAAGPRAAAARTSLEQAGEHFARAADVLERVENEVALASQARRVSVDSFARARELVAAALLPWPYVYAALGAIQSGLKNLHTDAEQLQRVVATATPLSAAAHARIAALSSPIANAGAGAGAGQSRLAGYAGTSYARTSYPGTRQDGQRIVPMRVQVRRGSVAERLYYQASALPGTTIPWPKAIAPGVSPRPLEDLIFHGGKIVPNMRFQNIYLGAAASWQQQDVHAIDRAIGLAMHDKRLNNVMAQYFDGPLECDVIPSKMLDEAEPVRLDEADVQAKITSLLRAGQLAVSDLDVTIFNLILPRRAILALDDSDSLNGLGGYHGSVHVTHEGRRVTLYYSANVYSEGGNGIPVFSAPWKNVVATLYHELNEFRTDADVNDAIQHNSNDFLGWMSRTGSEVGDEPIAVARSLDLVFREILVEGTQEKVPVQFMYSNAVHGPEGPIDIVRRERATDQVEVHRDSNDGYETPGATAH